MLRLDINDRKLYLFAILTVNWGIHAPRRASKFCKYIFETGRRDFKKAVISTCQHVFYRITENYLTWPKNVNDMLTVIKERNPCIILTSSNEGVLCRGCMNFIGVLYNEQILSRQSILNCAYSLLNIQEPYLLCFLLQTIGPYMEADVENCINDCTRWYNLFFILQVIVKYSFIKDEFDDESKQEINEIIEMRESEWVPEVVLTIFNEITEGTHLDTSFESFMFLHKKYTTCNINSAEQRRDLCSSLFINGIEQPVTFAILFRQIMENGILMETIFDADDTGKRIRSMLVNICRVNMFDTLNGIRPLKVIKFIGELNELNILTNHIMLSYIDIIFDGSVNDHHLLCLCVLLTKIGHKMEAIDGVDLTEYFTYLQHLISEYVYKHYALQRVYNLIELRENNWISM